MYSVCESFARLLLGGGLAERKHIDSNNANGDALNITDGLNANQKSAVLETEGPILIIAGPGSGKTLTLVRRTLHIIQSGLAQPHEIILCSFTEKSAHELKERIASNAQDLGITQDLSSLVIGTIHGICAAIIEDNLERANLGKNYDVLDDVTKLLFIHQNFEEIVGLESETGTFIEGKYKSKWSAIKGLSKYFDKISDELINARDLLRDSNPVTAAIAIAYLKYLELLVANNKVDFAHLQVKALDVLTSKTDSSLVLPKYVMIDEFQDTNFVQERLVSLLAESSGNLCVVGDEDQSLYRFRGATVENILSFPESRPDTKIFELDINYRSEPRIVKLYKDFMESGTWTKDGNRYRFSKHLEPADYEETTYPSVYLNNALDPDDEAIRNAKFIRSLKDSGFIGDYSEVAILLRSVREQHSLPFRAALASEGIKSFCPRAKTFFRNEEVGLIFASLAHILGREDNPNSKGKAWDLNMYLRSYAEELLDLAQLNPALEDILRKSRESVLSLAENQTMDKRAVDFLFDLLAAEPFRSWMLETERAR
ncbi:MAG: ATP-dependent helicase, partial [Micrococcales bacterium]|nr:ATP-dependent helicase [Micrococcales bacterium]